mgnify:CR=1 FL=1
MWFPIPYGTISSTRFESGARPDFPDSASQNTLKLVIGAIWLLWLLEYNLSLGVIVGIIALAGLDAETGAIMLLYLDIAHDKQKAAGRLRTRQDLEEAVTYLRQKGIAVANTPAATSISVAEHTFGLMLGMEFADRESSTAAAKSAWKWARLRP